MPVLNPAFDDEPLLKKRVAVLKCQKFQQDKIASHLGISQSAVSRLIREALKDGSLIESMTCAFPEAEQLTNELLQVKRLDERLHELMDRAGQTFPKMSVPRLFVHHVGAYREPNDQQDGDAIGMREWDEAVVRFGRSAAHSIRDLITPCRCVGISWGRQLRASVDGLRAIPRPPNKNPIQIVPLWGQRLTLKPEPDDTIFTNHTRLSSNSLATDLLDYFNPPGSVELHHLPVFDFIPIDPQLAPFEGATAAQLRNNDVFVKNMFRVFSLIESYRRVFGDGVHEKGLVHELDAIIASVGLSGSRAMGRSTEDYGGIRRDWLSTFIEGDVAGVLFQKDERSIPKELKQDGRFQAAQQIFNRICTHWTGVKHSDLERCAVKAKKSKYGGVIVLAVGRRRARIVLRAIREGLISTLITDTQLADALLDELNAEL